MTGTVAQWLSTPRCARQKQKDRMDATAEYQERLNFMKMCCDVANHDHFDSSGN